MVAKAYNLAPGSSPPVLHAGSISARRVPGNDRNLVTHPSLGSFRGGFAALFGVAAEPINPFGHQGLYHDEDTPGLIYNRARILHARYGRFLQRDPLGYVDGMSVYAIYGLDPMGLKTFYRKQELLNATGILHVHFLLRYVPNPDDGLKALTAEQLKTVAAEHKKILEAVQMPNFEGKWQVRIHVDITVDTGKTWRDMSVAVDSAKDDSARDAAIWERALHANDAGRDGLYLTVRVAACPQKVFRANIVPASAAAVATAGNYNNVIIHEILGHQMDNFDESNNPSGQWNDQFRKNWLPAIISPDIALAATARSALESVHPESGDSIMAIQDGRPVKKFYDRHVRSLFGMSNLEPSPKPGSSHSLHTESLDSSSGEWYHANAGRLDKDKASRERLNERVRQHVSNNAGG